MKKVAIVLTICMVLSILGGGVVFAKGGPPTGAGAAKMPLYNSTGEKDVGWTCASGALKTDEGPYGFVILNTNTSGELIVEFALKGAIENATFDLYVNQVDTINGCTIQAPNLKGELTTNGRGNGNAHFNLPRWANADRFWVSAMEQTVPPYSGQCLRSVAVVLD